MSPVEVVTVQSSPQGMVVVVDHVPRLLHVCFRLGPLAQKSSLAVLGPGQVGAELVDPLECIRDGVTNGVASLQQVPKLLGTQGRLASSILGRPGTLGQLCSAGDGGLVDPAAGQGLAEHVEGGLLALECDEDFVAVPAPGHGHVHTPGIDGTVKEKEGPVERSALVGVTGLGVGQFYVVGHVVGRQADGARPS